jgi:hypothetical protein
MAPPMHSDPPHAADGGRAVLAAWEFLRHIERMATPPMHEAPPAWRRLVVRADKSVDRRAYTFCVLQTLLAALNGTTCTSRQASDGVIRARKC